MSRRQAIVPVGADGAERERGGAAGSLARGCSKRLGEAANEPRR